MISYVITAETQSGLTARAFAKAKFDCKVHLVFAIPRELSVLSSRSTLIEAKAVLADCSKNFIPAAHVPRSAEAL